MTRPKTDSKEEQVLILAPTGRDAALTHQILTEAGISSEVCKDMEGLCLELDRGVGAVLMTEEALTKLGIKCLVEALDRQPAWSDLPLILFATNSESAGILLNTLGNRANVMILERPINLGVLVGAVRSSLRARRRQYGSRDLLKKLEEADRQKNIFLATLSHELRTPLNAAVGWTEILTKHRLKEVEFNRAVETIKRNMKSLTLLINDMLDVSRIISGKLQLNVSRLNLVSVIEMAVGAVALTAKSKAIQLRATFGCSDCHVLGDPDRLQQVVTNLLTNAIKFTPEGGSIDVRLELLDGHAQITVADTGQGITPEFLPYVFDRFLQADGSYTRTQGGLGLGLAIVRHLLEMHGGNVRAESEGEGKGATFFVSLPLKADHLCVTDSYDAGLTLSPPHSPDGVQLDGVRVMVVDDEADAREMLATMLTEYGAEVMIAGSADEALDAITKETAARLPHVLVSDIGMPGKDGYDLIRELRALGPERGGGIPAVALTGYASTDERERAVSEGFQMHLAKPVKLAELAAVIAGLKAQAKEA
ncbi:MAG TPA: ATP-binding protein [Blastocatellia bacterium]|jgi:signal transduction histidine kinase/CheY-like chemotaxis protein|nr:ATP-binding protein [Blastocatellia bacterium]